MQLDLDKVLLNTGENLLLRSLEKLREIYRRGAKLEEVPVQKIKVFEDFRNKGNLDDLAKSMHTVGQVNPVVLFKRGEDYFLVLGLRRLNSVEKEGKILALVYEVQGSDEEIRKLVICARVTDSLTIAFSNRTRAFYIRELESFGLNEGEISKVLGIHPSRVSRLKKEIGLTGALSRLPESLREEILDKIDSSDPLAQELAKQAIDYRLTKEQIRDAFRLAGNLRNAYSLCFRAVTVRDLFPESLRKKLERCLNTYLLRLASVSIGRELDTRELKNLTDEFRKIADQVRLVVAVVVSAGGIKSITVDEIKLKLQELGFTPPPDALIQEVIRICGDPEGSFFLLGGD